MVRGREDTLVEKRLWNQATASLPEAQEMKNLHSTKGNALEKLLWGLKVIKMRCFPLMNKEQKSTRRYSKEAIHPFSLCVETRWLRVARYSGGSIASTTLYLSPCKSPWKTSSVVNSTLSPEPRPSPEMLLYTALKTPVHCIGPVIGIYLPSLPSLYSDLSLSASLAHP